MNINLPVKNQKIKIALAKSKNLLNITNKILANKNSATIEDYLNKQMESFSNKLDQNDIKIAEQLIPDIIPPLLDSVDKNELDLWIKTLQNDNNKYDLEYYIGSTILLALCKYALLPDSTSKISMLKLSGIFKELVQTTNSIFTP
jgi:hypothetical protein